MAVKDLIQRYEVGSPSTTYASSSSEKLAVREGSSSSTPTLIPIPARFIQHKVTPESDPPLIQASGALSSNFRTGSIVPPSTQQLDRPKVPKGHNEKEAPGLLFPDPPDSGEPRISTIKFAEEKDSLLNHTYPPSIPRKVGQSRGLVSITESYSNGSLSSTLSHIPIPATKVFARNAAPLHLPRLDDYLSSLPRASFPEMEQKVKEGVPQMFPPMDRLKKLGMSLDDLEDNSTVAPFWRNRAVILGSTLNVVIGFLGSSALASFYSLQGLVNTVQVFALILSTIVPAAGHSLEDKWQKLFMGTIPNILALNFASTLTQSLLYLVIFMAIAACFLYYFYRSTLQCDCYNTIEGLQQTESKGNQWGLVIVTFLLTVIYLPLSTMAVHVLVWSQELWAVPNPYINSTATPPAIPPLGPIEEFRDPLDFCWTTTMKRNEVNYAPIIVILAAVAFGFLTIWFPLALRRVIQQSVPKVDRYNGLGRLRSNADLDAEYHRLLDRDRNPFAFLYSGFRRGWATYESTYLIAKLSTLVLVAVIDPDNCLFRSSSRTHVPIIRQVLLLVSTVGFFVTQCLLAPFLDPVNNASEWTSRLNYLTTATTALLITLDIPNKQIIETYVLYSIYIVTYGLGFYFSVINLAIMQRVVKRLMRRIDFSIDIFSPRLDVSLSSIHIRHRIWQESVTTHLLTDPDCRIPAGQPMLFAQARDTEYPPYLMNFEGTPAERHVENMKILREVGELHYTKAVTLLNGPDYSWYKYLEEEIQKHHIGPDSYWKNPKDSENPTCKSNFGNAWWIPFPPTLVLRYDDGPLAVLREVAELEAYLTQNSEPDIQRRKQIRMSLRALEGQRVYWPYEYKRRIGSASSWFRNRGRYSATMSINYRTCLLRIRRKGTLLWEGLQLGSGFQVELIYGKNITTSGEAIGLNDDFDLTSPLAKFLELNRQVIENTIQHIEDAFGSYRRYHRKESRWKNRVLSYRFLAHVYSQPRDPTGLPQSSIEGERDPRVQQLMLSSEAVFRSMYERFTSVSKSEVSTWWYIFWDDLWRRNYDTIAGLERHAADFNPHYPTSIAYTPLPRATLESFLIQRGLLHKKPRLTDFFHAGFLNKLYLRLNDCVFRDSKRAVMFHLGHDRHELDMEEVDIITQGNPSTLGTGGGTDHDVSWIRARPTYRWEGLLTDPVSTRDWGKRRWFTKFGAWFGLNPLWRTGALSQGLSLDVRLEDGRYVLLDDTASSTGPSSRHESARP